MSLRYRDSSGNETIVSGLTPGGDIEAGAVDTRTGTYNLSGTNWVKQNIVFDSPMPDADYEIITEEHQCAGFTSGQFLIENKTVNGFTIGIYFTSTTAANNRYTGTWKAVKTYTVQHAAQNAEDITNIKAVIPSTASSTNKLATSNDVSSLATSTDSRLDDLEDLIPTGASVTNQLTSKSYVDTQIATKQDPLTFDNVPTAGSSNPMTSDGIKTALDNKQTVLTFDNIPTAGSGNPVKSNGIKNALDVKQNEQLADPVTVGSNTYDTVNAALTGIGGMINSGLSLGLTFTSLTNNANMNNCTDTTFKIWGSANTATCASFVNGPSGRQNGEMAIIWIPFGNVLYGAQLYFAGAGVNTPQIFIRYRANTTWSSWVKLH
jgi:hypothetical protein